MSQDHADQWKFLKKLLSEYDGRSQDFDGRRFKWVDIPGEPLLALNEVCSMLIDISYRIAPGWGCSITFCHKPSSSVAADPPPHRVTWSLKLEIQDGEFIWLRDGRSFTTEVLAEGIVKKLADYHREYEKANVL